ncbi:MAG: alkaline phosphatase family protein, partial [Desulfurococcaceae archaeon]
MKAWTSLALLLVVSLLAVSALNYTVSVGSEGQRFKVVVLSVDAVRFDHLIMLAEQGVLPNIARVLGSGVYAELVTVYPSATAVAHAAISTGAPPGVNGIVGNAIHLPGTTVTSTVSGFSGFNLQAEPVWITADKHGLRSIVVSFPQSTPPAWNVTRSILFNIYDASAVFTASTLYTTNTSVPRATYINFTEAVNWTGVESVLGSVSKALESTIRIGDTTWYLYLVDTDGDDLFDKLAIAPEKDLTKAFAVLSEGEWSKPINTTVTAGGRVYTVAPLFKAIRFNPVADFRLYRGITRPLEAPWYNVEDVARDVWNSVIVRTGTFTDGDFSGL